MDYLEYFGLSAEPFLHAPVSRYYYASRQHTEALKRLLYAVKTMKGLALLIGDIGHGKTTLARRLLDALPEAEFEAAMLVIVHAGVTASWLLKRIAVQLGVESPADDKLTILSQLYDRLLAIHKSGKRTVVLIDEAQMLATRELMEEFRGLLNLEVPGHKLISFVFFGLPEIERNLQLDPPLAQRVALRYHLKSLSLDETTAYVQHRLRLVGAAGDLIPAAALEEVHKECRGVPRVINTLCDNVLLEMYFARLDSATPELVTQVAENLGLSRMLTASEAVPEAPGEPVPEEGGEDAIQVISRSDVANEAESQSDVAPIADDGLAAAAAVASEPASVPSLGEAPSPTALAVGAPAGGTAASARGRVDAEVIAAKVAEEVSLRPAEARGVDRGPPPAPMQGIPRATTVDIDDPLAFLADARASAKAGGAPPRHVPAVAPAALPPAAAPVPVPKPSPEDGLPASGAIAAAPRGPASGAASSAPRTDAAAALDDRAERCEPAAVEPPAIAADDGQVNAFEAQVRTGEAAISALETEAEVDADVEVDVADVDVAVDQHQTATEAAIEPATEAPSDAVADPASDGVADDAATQAVTEPIIDAGTEAASQIAIPLPESAAPVRAPEPEPAGAAGDGPKPRRPRRPLAPDDPLAALEELDLRAPLPRGASVPAATEEAPPPAAAADATTQAGASVAEAMLTAIDVAPEPLIAAATTAVTTSAPKPAAAQVPAGPRPTTVRSPTTTPATAAPRTVKTSRGTIDLAEIDDLLADLKR